MASVHKFLFSSLFEGSSILSQETCDSYLIFQGETALADWLQIDPQTNLEIVRYEKVWNYALADITLLAFGIRFPQISLATIDALQNLGDLYAGDARVNANLNGIHNVKFIQGDVNKIDENFGNYFPKPDIVISDPNRPGMHMKLIKFLLRLKSPRIVSANRLHIVQSGNICIHYFPKYTNASF